MLKGKKRRINKKTIKKSIWNQKIPIEKESLLKKFWTVNNKVLKIIGIIVTSFVTIIAFKDQIHKWITPP